ncbi:Wadjet anti-phage system protein JetD domain-containing protein [Virgisporangium aurantiacum]|uniref:DUF3322 and DUF2220 domain-containing protein n=1 Tax=Virgisporangium aurantiacum TaxID=175570 RepID=A0A8J3ZLG7_9ACTN|nr:Wadjet anti-phage system protein JetD domain-containing protein [Virgisporangium aurantiacum]GIJ63666.1 hypothetical protein Vau01_111820 [Virgisporangium aurantiacum]
MKTIERLLADIERRLSNTWAHHIASTHYPPQPQDAEALPAAWPYAFPLGQLASAGLARDFSAVAAWATNWRAWSHAHGTMLRTRTRLVHGTDQELPTHVVIGDVDNAARLCGSAWVQRLELGRRRATVLAQQFPHLVRTGVLAATVAAVDDLSDVDFDLLCRAGVWFASHDATGLTPRQVPIEGLHAKWLNHRHGLVRRLASREDLGLLPPHSPRVHFTYLDPVHRSAGLRWHDSATVDDHMTPAYQPQVVVISENKDTAIHFPELDAGISVEGVGRGGTTVAALPWLVAASHIFYWGDMDADGLEILNEFRAAGVPAASLFMDLSAYTEWERYGTNLDPRGRPLQPRTPRPVPLLTDAETELFHCLTSEAWTRYRRIEQERIPLGEAVSTVRRIVGSPLRDR